MDPVRGYSYSGMILYDVSLQRGKLLGRSMYLYKAAENYVSPELTRKPYYNLCVLQNHSHS